MTKGKGIARRRPAELTSGVAGSLALLIVIALGIEDPRVVGALVVVLGAIPAAVTWLVERFRHG